MKHPKHINPLYINKKFFPSPPNHLFKNKKSNVEATREDSIWKLFIIKIRVNDQFSPKKRNIYVTLYVTTLHPSAD